MSRVPQPAGQRGSLKWIQRLVNAHQRELDAPLKAKLGAANIEWLSPLAGDEFAEYRDLDFLKTLQLGHLGESLKAFWPDRGPQWDALARSDTGNVILVEAKAHIGELCSPGTMAGEASRLKIDAALAATATALGASPRAPWADLFYQLANRLAHLHFLRQQGVDAWLVLVNFVGDDDMAGPKSASEWQAAYSIVHHVMGLPARHSLARYVLHVYPDVAVLT